MHDCSVPCGLQAASCSGGMESGTTAGATTMPLQQQELRPQQQVIHACTLLHSCKLDWSPWSLDACIICVVHHAKVHGRALISQNKNERHACMFLSWADQCHASSGDSVAAAAAAASSSGGSDRYWGRRLLDWGSRNGGNNGWNRGGYNNNGGSAAAAGKMISSKLCPERFLTYISPCMHAFSAPV